MSTKAVLRAAIKREARVLANANLDTLVDDIVTDLLRDACNLARYHELLLENVAIVLVAQQQSYNLPADYHNLAAVRYGRGPNPTTFRVVDEQPDTVKQTSRQGWPRFYRLIRGGTKGKISFWPYYDIVVADQLVIDYYIDPASIYAADADEFPIPRIEGAIKKEAIARVQRFHSSTEEAQMTGADSQSSFNASNAAS